MDGLLQLLTGKQAFTEAELCDRLSIAPDALRRQLADLRALGYRVTERGGLRLDPRPGSLLPGYILTELDTGWMGRGTILYASEMSSTNTVLRQAAAETAMPRGSLAVCDRQTAGKGRLQRVWQDAGGVNLTCSVLLRPQMPRERFALLTLATAVAAAETLAELRFEAGIKWPNDVVIGGRKCVGILCETLNDPEGAPCVVVGTGFNVNQKSFDGELATKATSLYLAGGKEVSRRALLCVYLRQMERAVNVLEAEGFAGILPRYAARTVTLGRRVEVIGAGETFAGVAESLEDTGALNVRDDTGALRRVVCGDVSVRGVMGYV